MKLEQILLGGVLMGLVAIYDVAAQPPAAHPVSGAHGQAARALIEAALQQTAAEKEAALQLTSLQQTSAQVLKLCAKNLEVTDTLRRALTRAAELTSDRQAARVLSDALRAAGATLAFKPYLESPLPEGFPELTPAGEIAVKQYPKYRLARTPMGAAEAGAFWTLFLHIKKQDIAMTAPVEMTYSVTGDGKLQGQTMAFLYRSSKQGALGKDQKVDVVDVPVMTAVSLGMCGDVTRARLAEARVQLDSWLQAHSDEYEACGPLRVMGYNSPFVAAHRRFTEVEIPVRRVTQPR